MIGWVVAAVLGSIALTALLTFVLWRMNGALRGHDRSSGHAGVIPVPAHDADNSGDSGSGDAGGGSDGGGGE